MIFVCVKLHCMDSCVAVVIVVCGAYFCEQCCTLYTLFSTYLHGFQQMIVTVQCLLNCKAYKVFQDVLCGV